MGKAPDRVIIPDPELLLPDEGLPHGPIYIAHSSFIGGEYLSIRAIIEKRKLAEARLNGQLAKWQRNLDTPCFVMYSVRNDATGERLLVYGEIPDMEALIKSERANGVTDLTALRRLRQRMESGLKRGWLYGKWHSRTEPNGEWGVMHKAFIQSAMSQAEFESIRAQGWEA